MLLGRTGVTRKSHEGKGGLEGGLEAPLALGEEGAGHSRQKEPHGQTPGGVRVRQHQGRSQVMSSLVCNLSPN